MKPSTRQISAGIRKAARRFRGIIDGKDIFDRIDDATKALSANGIRIVSSRRGVLDNDYKPESRIERLLEQLFPGRGVNENDNVFTVEMDAYQTIVFEHAGQMFCSDWVLDLRNRVMELVPKH